MKEKSTVGSPFFAVFPSARIPKATKDVSIHSFIHVSNFQNYNSKFRERCLATMYVVSFTNSVKHATTEVHKIERAIQFKCFKVIHDWLYFV